LNRLIVMTPRHRRFLPAAILLPLLLLQPTRASAAELIFPRRLSSYTFDAHRPLAERVTDIPGWLLDAWRRTDDEPRYRVYRPRKEEKKIFASALAELPGPMRSALEDRLIGFYFVENLKGNGITDWVRDPSGRVFVYMILNPAGFRSTLSQVLSI